MIPKWVLWASLIFILLVISAYSFEWTGFLGKTPWDWLDLLIVPAIITVGAYLLDQRQRQRELEIQNRIREQEQESENQREQDRSLQNYLYEVGQLLLDRGLRESENDSEIRTLARAYTLATLAELGPEGKRSVLRFLRDARLITKERPVVSLDGADLSHMVLLNTNLNGAFLDDADLKGASLNAWRISGVQITSGEGFQEWQSVSAASLVRARLKGANLMFASLQEVDLEGADMRGADLTLARVSNKQLAKVAQLAGARLPSGDLYSVGGEESTT